MYKPRLIEAECLFSFKNLRYEFNNGVTTLVNGENRDNDSQESNGSGKSSLIEAVAIALTGGPLRKVKNDEIINDEADEAFLRLTLDNDILNETFIISRRFFRKSASIVSIQIFKDGKEVDDPLLNTLSSVDEYNKAILERIGLTRDEIFNNFTLSKYRYVNFLSVSDTKKKEVINQFSRGNAIDQAIAELKKDAEPLKSEVDDLNLEAASETGKFEALKEQLDEINNSKEENQKNRDEKIAEIETKISQSRKTIRGNNSKIRDLETKISKLEDLIDSLNDKFDGCADQSAEDQINTLLSFLSENNIEFDQNFHDELKKIKASSVEYETAIDNHGKKIDEIKIKSEKLDGEISKLSNSPNLDKGKHDKKVAKFHNEIEELSKKMTTLRSDVKNLKKSKTTLEESREELSIKLMGKITCPKCSHEFLTAEKDFDVESGEAKLKSYESDIKCLKDEIITKTQDGVELKEKKETQEDRLDDLEDKFEDLEDKLKKLKRNRSNLDLEIKAEESKILTNQESIKQIDSKVDKFIEDSFNDVISQLEKDADDADDEIKKIEIDNSKIDGSIANSTERVDSLKADNDTENIKSIEEKIKIVKKDKRTKERELQLKSDELEKYLEQEQIFIDFKTHLANSKIEDLGNITNDFLEAIGSDLRVEFSGFTKLKSGKIRDKISIKLLRDGVDAGSFGKFSGGEQARISLANILALAKLINVNCDEGKGLDLLILDEILEAVDGSGLANMLAALNESKVTCIVVSHGLVAENYEYVQKVIKENDESRIE